jgi:trk/ktr system potassium uptake protein
MLHPRIVSALKVNGRIVSERVIQAVWAYFAVYGALFGTFVLVLMAGGLDAVSAFGAVAACVNNLGPGLGVVANNFTAVADSEKWLLALAMLLGRLEIFTILVLFTPAYWRR